MKISILIFTLLLTGCTTVPVKIPFPTVPPQLMEPAGSLKPLDKNKEIQLNLPYLATGVYVAHLRSGNKFVQTRIIKQP